MRMELRARLDKERVLHHDLVLIPTDREAQILDDFLEREPRVDWQKCPVKITGEVRTDDSFGIYLLIRR